MGNGHVPPASLGAGETVGVEFVKPTADGTTHMLLTVTPDDRLVVKRLAMHWPHFYDRQITNGPTETTGLSPKQAADFRQRLSQFRPPQLNQDAPILLPKGCTMIADGSSRIVAFFRNAQGGSGIFLLQNGCQNSNAIKLAQSLQKAVTALPATKAATGF